MLQIEKTVLPSPEQWEIIIEGMRNPMNSWDKMDSGWDGFGEYDGFSIGPNDHNLMMKLANGGSTHAKYRRMIPVYFTVTSSLYFFKELDTYKVGTVCNSCSTMHKIHAKEFTLDDFSCEKLEGQYRSIMEYPIIPILNLARECFIESGEKFFWEQMIQLLPTSYNQKRTYMVNYEVLHNIYHSRKNHKLDEWHTFCDWIKTLPYSELITGE